MGANITETPDGMMIRGLGVNGQPGRLKGATCVSHGDHRVAMSLAIAALVADSPLVIEDTDCITTSFPEFEHKLLELLTARA
jgi:3-phosphoshikimate 1-carboxyvinyltransferase